MGVNGTAGGRRSRWYMAGAESRDGEQDTREEEVKNLEEALGPTNERARKGLGAEGTRKELEGGQRRTNGKG